MKTRTETFQNEGLPSLLFAVLFAACLYDNEAGIAYPVFMLGTLALLRKIRIHADRMSLFYEITLMLSSISVCTTASSTLWNLDFLLIICLGACYVLHCFQEDLSWGTGRYLGGMFRIFVSPLVRLFDPLLDGVSYFKDRKKDRKEKSTFRSVLLGLAIAAILVPIVLLLLSGADMVFRMILENAFGKLALSEGLLRFFRILLMGIAGFIIFYTVVKRQTQTQERKQGTRKILSAATAVTFLSILAAVYALFVIIQLVFLFFHTGLPSGITYAQYAHQGFYQLLAVCILNYILVGVTSAFFEKSRAVLVLETAVGICTYGMLFSSAYRMILYVLAYKLTFLRVFVLWFLAVLAICMFYLLRHAADAKVPLFRYCMITVTVMYLAFAFLHPDFWIARYNLTRGNDSCYLIHELSADALPALKNAPVILENKLRYIPGNSNDIRTFNIGLWLDLRLIQ